MIEKSADEVKKFWDERAKLKDLAGSNDFLLKKIEMQAIKRHLYSGLRVLEIGCGSGGTAIELAKTYDLEILALDYSESMISAANEALAGSGELQGSVKFSVGDIRSLPALGAAFDVVFTERVLINLDSWEEQQNAIHKIIDALVPSGRYLMCENSMEGLERINVYREACGLSPISLPWHNRYFHESELEQFTLPNAKLVAIEHISSSYYFVSRVINAWLAKEEGIEPKYDALMNNLGLCLPELGNMGQTKLWIFEKKQDA